MAAIDLKRATLVVHDGAAASVTVKIGEGNLTFSEKRNMEYVLDRGLLDTVKEGDQVPVEVKFDFMWEYISGTTVGTGLRDIVSGTTNYVSTDSDACRPYACDVVLTYQPVPSTCGDAETITFPDFRMESLDYDLKAATVSCSGKCNVTRITSVRAAAGSSTPSPSATPSST
jgi:hypothetical protein